MAKPKASEIYIATETFACELDGVPTVVHKGERIRGSHALVQIHSGYFEPADVSLKYDVEKTTQAPGEKRGE